MWKRWLLLCMVLWLAGRPAPALALSGTVTASALVLRAGPGLGHSMLGEIPEGTVLSLISYGDGWYEVDYGGTIGFVHGDYVAVDDGKTGHPAPEALQDTPLAQGGAPGLSLPPLTFTGKNNPAYPLILRPGDMGNSVIDLQVTLQNFGHAVKADGLYGYDTQAAVMKLQRLMGLTPDGLLGPGTRALIGKTEEGVERLDWWHGGNVAFARLSRGVITDVRTGKRFAVQRYGGDSHCDVEPVAEADTRTLLEISGGAYSWARRPVWLAVGGRVIAASMHSMPHGGAHIGTNGYEGHFCVHFYGSHTHESARVDEEHAACVQEAWERRNEYFYE